MSNFRQTGRSVSVSTRRTLRSRKGPCPEGFSGNSRPARRWKTIHGVFANIESFFHRLRRNFSRSEWAIRHLNASVSEGLWPEQRSALWVRISPHGLPIEVVTTHFGLSSNERRSQMSALRGRDWLEPVSRPQARDPLRRLQLPFWQRSLRLGQCENARCGCRGARWLIYLDPAARAHRPRFCNPAFCDNSCGRSQKFLKPRQL